MTIIRNPATRRDLMGYALGAAALAVTVPLSIRVNAGEPRVFTGLEPGVGAGGYDVVAYFKVGGPTKGDPALSADFDGATWWFSSAENRDAFVADPSRYAPQYGGYCAWAAAEGYTAKGDPKHWTVVDNKLYLNFNGRIQRRWEKDIPGHIARGDANWPSILSGG